MERTHHFPDIIPSQVPLPALHICYDFISLLTHGCHIQIGLVAVTFTDMFVQTASGAMRTAMRDEQAWALS